MHARAAKPADSAAVARIYNEGIDDRVATFETRHRTAGDVVQWLDGHHPVVVVEEDDGEVIAFAATSTYRPRKCYAGIAEFSVYAARVARGRGAGRMAMEALFNAARDAGFWKVVSRVFIENTNSRGLLRAVGFREVGVYELFGRVVASRNRQYALPDQSVALSPVAIFRCRRAVHVHRAGSRFSARISQRVFRGSNRRQRQCKDRDLAVRRALSNPRRSPVRLAFSSDRSAASGACPDIRLFLAACAGPLIRSAAQNHRRGTGRFPRSTHGDGHSVPTYRSGY